MSPLAASSTASPPRIRNSAPSLSAVAIDLCYAETYARGITFYNNFIIYTVIKFSTYCVINSCKLPLPYLIAQSQSSNATSFYNKNIMSFTKQQTYLKNKWYTKVDFTTLKAEQIPTKRSVAHVE